MIVVNETAVKVACICCGAEKYATQAPYLCHNCWKSGEAAKLIQQLTPRALDTDYCACNPRKHGELFVRGRMICIYCRRPCQ